MQPNPNLRKLQCPYLSINTWQDNSKNKPDEVTHVYSSDLKKQRQKDHLAKSLRSAWATQDPI